MKVYIVLGECYECNGQPVAAFSSLEKAQAEFPHTSIVGLEVDSPVAVNKYRSKEPTTPIEWHG